MVKENKDYISPVEIEEDEIDLLELLGVLVKYKWMIILITFIGAVGVFLYVFVSIKLPPEKSYLPNLYKSTAQLLINEEQSSSFALPSGVSGLASLAGLSVGGKGGYGPLAVELAKSNPIIDVIVKDFKIIKRYNIKDYPQYSSRKAVLSRLDVKYDEDTRILKITYKDWDPAFSRDVVNRIVKLLDDRFAGIGINKNLNQKKLLEEKLVTINIEITRLETKIKDFQKKYGVLQIQDLAAEQLSTLAQLKSQLILKELEINTYTKFSRIDDPVISRMRSERDNLDKLIKQMEKGQDSNIFSFTGPSLEQLPELALEFAHLKRELLVQEEIFKTLTQQYELVKLKVEGEGPIFQVLELGGLSDKKAEPSRSIIVIVTVFLFFFIAIIGVFIRNAWVNIKKDPSRLAKLKGK